MAQALPLNMGSYAPFTVGKATPLPPEQLGKFSKVTPSTNEGLQNVLVFPPPPLPKSGLCLSHMNWDPDVCSEIK